MHSSIQIAVLLLTTAKRDKLLHAIAAVGFLLVVLIPAFSFFSIREVQELAITIATSALSLILLVVTLLAGASSIWRDIERRYTSSLLGLPLSRHSYVLGKFLGITAVIAIVALVLGATSLVAIKVAASQYKSDIPLVWENVVAAMLFDLLKYLLLLAFALLFSTVSTSFYFPFFSTMAVYMAGSASQEVYEYISGSYGEKMAPLVLLILKGLYYLLPNFSAFNLKVYAIYGLPLTLGSLMLTLLYFSVFTAMILTLAVWSFSRRELP